VSTAVRVTRALLALQQLLDEPLPEPVQDACGKAVSELSLYRKTLAAGVGDEDPFGNQR